TRNGVSASRGGWTATRHSTASSLPKASAIARRSTTSFAMMSDAAEERARLERSVAEMRGTLGEEHLATLSAMLDLADSLWNQGRLIAARKIETQVVAGRRRALGEEHFDTLK